MVRRPCSFGVGAVVVLENDVVTDLFRLFFGSISITAGLDAAGDGFGAWDDGIFFILMCTLSVVKTGGDCAVCDVDCCTAVCLYLFAVSD